MPLPDSPSGRALEQGGLYLGGARSGDAAVGAGSEEEAAKGSDLSAKATLSGRPVVDKQRTPAQIEIRL
jgi:hypothetical protein